MRYFRAYKNGTRSPVIEAEREALEGLIAFNKVMRFGCAQFLDGKCVYPGYLTPEEIAKVEQQEVDRQKSNWKTGS